MEKLIVLAARCEVGGLSRAWARQARLGHTVAVLPLRLAAYARLAFREGLPNPGPRHPSVLFRELQRTLLLSCQLTAVLKNYRLLKNRT
jgi:hypothetical protein